MSPLSANRAWRCCRYPTAFNTPTPNYYDKEATLVDVSDAKLIVKFYTPKGSQLQDPRSVVNFHDFQLFRTSNLSAIDAPKGKDLYGYVETDGKFPAFKVETLTSSNIQRINSIKSWAMSLAVASS